MQSKEKVSMGYMNMQRYMYPTVVQCAMLGILCDVVGTNLYTKIQICIEVKNNI